MSTYRDFLIEYPFEGETWGLRISARSRAEAEARVKALPWAAVKGEIMATIPVSPISIFKRIAALFNRARSTAS